MDIRIEWHSLDQVYAAVFVRDGEPWYLNGALVGVDSRPDTAVLSLVEQAEYLILHGENFLTEAFLSVEDRVWLYWQLDPGCTDDEMWKVLRNLGAQV